MRPPPSGFRPNGISTKQSGFMSPRSPVRASSSITRTGRALDSGAMRCRKGDTRPESPPITCAASAISARSRPGGPISDSPSGQPSTVASGSEICGSAGEPGDAQHATAPAPRKRLERRLARRPAAARCRAGRQDDARRRRRRARRPAAPDRARASAAASGTRPRVTGSRASKRVATAGIELRLPRS